MDKLQKQVKLARRRLILVQFQKAIVWSLLITLSLVTIAFAVPKIWPITLAEQARMWWIVGLLGGSLLAGFLVAGVWTFLLRRTQLDAAIEIDRRCGLKERVSSSLALSEEQRESEAGRAVIADAKRRIERTDVRAEFPTRPTWRILLPLAPAVVLFLLIVVVPDAVPPKVPNPSNEAQAEIQRLDATTNNLKRELAERRLQAKEKNLKEAAELFDELEQELDRKPKQAEVKREERMVKLNELSDRVKQRQKELGGAKQVQQQLEHLNTGEPGPADKLAKAMKSGDLETAKKEINELKKKIANNELSQEEKKQLEKQVKQLAKKMKDIADAQKQAKSELKKKQDQAKQAGDQDEVERLQKELDQLAQQDNQMQRLSDMAEKLSKCSECMGQGNQQSASQQMQQLADDLQRLQKEYDELEMLDDALDQISQAREEMRCGGCQGDGEGEGSKPGQLAGQGGSGQGNREGPPGTGSGDGQGVGARPEEKDETGFWDARVPSNPGPGKAVVVDRMPGPNVVGQARQDIKSSLEAARSEEDRPLTEIRLPREQREHAQQYFDAFREGE